MKRYILKAAGLLISLILLTACLTSCNKLSGSYTSDTEGDVDTTYKFSLFSDKITMSYLGIELNGTYEIDEDNGKIYITFVGDRQEYTYEKNGKTITIDGVVYNKE